LRELSHREAVEPLARYAAVRLSLMLVRHQLLEQGESRDRTLVEASERRLIRTAYDLHDGPLQEIALLADELRLFGTDVEPLLDEGCRPAVRDALASIHERTVRLEFEMREISRALETSVVGRHSLDELLEREAAALAARTGIEVLRDVRTEFDGLSDSQRIVLYRGVQEALSNVARHSGASKVTIRVRRRAGGIALTVVDDGAGFDATHALAAAARRGRLGLVGIGERVRLLGGVLTVTSLPGSGTTVGIVLPAWVPPGEPGEEPYSS
jgi:signal transduction histidine kinase